MTPPLHHQAPPPAPTTTRRFAGRKLSAAPAAFWLRLWLLAGDAIDCMHEQFDVYPLWLCPMKVLRPPPCPRRPAAWCTRAQDVTGVSLPRQVEDHGEYFIQPPAPAMYVDVGAYGNPGTPHRSAPLLNIVIYTPRRLGPSRRYTVHICYCIYAHRCSIGASGQRSDVPAGKGGSKCCELKGAPVTKALVPLPLLSPA